MVRLERRERERRKERREARGEKREERREERREGRGERRRIGGGKGGGRSKKKTGPSPVGEEKTTPGSVYGYPLHACTHSAIIVFVFNFLV